MSHAAFLAMDEAIFAAFAETEPCAVVRGESEPVLVDVVVERGVAKLGEFGQVVGRVTRANFRRSQWQPQPGDVLTVDAIDRAIVSIEEDDGYIVKAVLHG